MIVIRNTQRKIKLDVAVITKQVQIVLDALKYSDFDIGIWFTSNKTIHLYNAQYRNKNKPTDILSFPFYPALKPGKRIVTENPEEKNLGDIIISPSYVLQDLPRWHQSFDERMKVLLVHGICHLLGYDHIQDHDYKVMQKKEQELLKLLS